MSAVSDVIARLRAHGVTVREWPGWSSRTNGQAPAYRGGIVHHTGSPYGSAYATLADGRPDLAGPLCNFAGNDDGSLTVVAAGPANHAGASGGRSMGPLPTTTSFNRFVMGLEIVYPGTSPMREAQYRTACIWARVVADVVGGGNIESVRAHAETSITGKWDPGYATGRTIDMAKFRADAAHVLEDNMLLDPADIARIVNGVLDAPVARQGNVPGAGKATSLRAIIGWSDDLATNAGWASSSPVLAEIRADLNAVQDDVTAIKARPSSPVDVVQLAAALAPLLRAERIGTPEEIALAVAVELSARLAAK